ncbi:MAG: DUF4249 domain-containing protein [Bacteroidota bacterium]
MNKSFNITALILLILGVASCVKPIELDLPPYSSKLVVNGELNTNVTVQLEVSRSMPILKRVDSSGYILKSASAKLFENNIFIGDLTYSGAFYTLNYKPLPGKNYRVEVSNPGLPSVIVNLDIPASLVSSSTYIDSIGLDNEGFPLGQLTVNFKDNPAANNYYEFLIRYYDASILQWFPLDIVSNDPVFLNNDKLDNGGYAFSDATFNGANKSIKIPIQFGTVNGSPKFEISIKTIQEDYFKYLEQVRDYQNDRGSFDTDPIILRSNVTNGLGMVGGVYNFKDTIQ